MRALVAHSGAVAGDLVLEVGPGTGTLTEALLDAGCEVVACELDDDMAAIIRDRLGSQVRLIHGDCLDGKHAVSAAILEALGDRPFKLVANLPYGAATPLILNLAAHHPTCLGQFVTVQREVAQRLAAAPGTEAYGAATVLLSLIALVLLAFATAVIAWGSLGSKAVLVAAIAAPMIPFLVFICVTALLGGMLNVRRHFWVAAFCPVLLNLCLISTIWLSPEREVWVAPYAILFAGLLMTAVSFCALKRTGGIPRLSFSPTEEYRQLRKALGGDAGQGSGSTADSQQSKGADRGQSQGASDQKGKGNGERQA